jgi:murein L,D-transpeptidase YafK
MESDNKFSTSYDVERMQVRKLVLTAAIIATLAVAGTAAWAYWPQDPLPQEARADLVVVRKGLRTLSLYKGDELLRKYRVALGSEPEDHKEQQGDGRTPEGRYVLDYRKPDSAVYKSIHISYPSVEDRITASERGLDPGGMIMVHGVRRGYARLGRLPSLFDWTAGCIAVSNNEMDDIWRVVPDGTQIIIEP